MRRLGMLGLLFLASCLGAGCQNIVGPFQPRSPMRVDDPNVSIAEQQKRSRERLALPDDSPNVAPRSSAGLPGTSPRY